MQVNIGKYRQNRTQQKKTRVNKNVRKSIQTRYSSQIVRKECEVVLWEVRQCKYKMTTWFCSRVSDMLSSHLSQNNNLGIQLQRTCKHAEQIQFPWRNCYSLALRASCSCCLDPTINTILKGDKKSSKIEVDRDRHLYWEARKRNDIEPENQSLRTMI